MGRVKVGIIGSGFQADVDCASFRIMPEEAVVVAIASPAPGRAAAFAAHVVTRLGDIVHAERRARA
jgi:predicted dehydrogenase